MIENIGLKYKRRLMDMYYILFNFSGGFSTGTSPQDIPNYINDATVRRTNSCPEMKKNSPGSTFATFTIIPPNKQSVPEEKDEENYEVGSPLHKNGPSNGEMLFEVCIETFFFSFRY